MPEFEDLDPACQNHDGWFRIVGFGSLLSRSSAKRSFPDLRDFRVVRIPRAVRVFGHAAPVFFERGIATPGPPFEFSSVCAEPGYLDDGGVMRPREKPSLGSKEQFALSREDAAQALANGAFMYVTAFYIPPEAMTEFRRREPEFTYVSVQVYALDEDAEDGIPAIMCGRGSDELVRERQDNSPKAWHEMVGRHGIDTLWNHDRNKLLPCPPYARLCILASEALGVNIKDNFLDTSFLADRRTTLRQHLERNPALLETLPPVAVRKYYTP